ncbi:MAG: cytochrome c oxidase accessory protein CcoG [Pseudomonadota bacterium]
MTRGEPPIMLTGSPTSEVRQTDPPPEEDGPLTPGLGTPGPGGEAQRQPTPDEKAQRQLSPADFAPDDIAPDEQEAAQGVEAVQVAAVNKAERRELYKAREPIYPKLVHGRWRTIKWVILFVTLGIYYGLPWVRWPRGPGEPDQAVLIDFPGQRFYFFFIEIWPDELYYVTALLIIASLSLFLVTAAFGRVWCGFTCPQTVWTDLFIAVERLVEGDRNARIKLAKARWSADKVGKKAAKHGLWLLIAAATGGAWVLYFHDAPQILPKLFTGDAPLSAYMFLSLLTFTTYIFAGSMREQVCTYMCPWPRVQAALTDARTLEVTYKVDRGEPRGKHKKGASWDDRGDCIDCKQCIAVCPMGIDIRDGDQLECIHCALCIDACNEVMDKVGRPRDLIGYDTADNAARRQAGEAPTIALFRIRTLIYTVLLVVISGATLATLITRATLTANVSPDRAPSYVQLSDGSIRNGYTVKIVNRANETRTFAIAPSGLVTTEFKSLQAPSIDGRVEVEANADAVLAVSVFLTASQAVLQAADAALIPITFTIVDVVSGEQVEKESVFVTGQR